MKIEDGLMEGQVLQRLGRKGATAHLRGTCAANGFVFARIFRTNAPLTGWRKKIVGKALSGKFSAKLISLPVGGPYHLELQVGTECSPATTFFVGDVWLLAGQSNMEGVGDMTHPAPPHPLIRSFSMARVWTQARDPLHLLRESPDPCHHLGSPFPTGEARSYRRQTKKGVGAGIFFAREMLLRSGVPQGLICTAHGGTTMRQWDPALKGDGGGSLYGSMLLSVRATGQPVAGLLWYQGESETTETERAPYTDRMKKLVAATRRDLRQPSLPWVIVQIGRVFDFPNRAPAWNDVQEQQRRLPGLIKNLETVSSIDLPLDDGIHISSQAFPRLATRLARAADRLIYGNRKEDRPPQLRNIHLSPLTNPPSATSIDVHFDHITGKLCADGEPRGFTLVTADGLPWPFIYKTTFHGPIARLHLSRLPGDDVQLHYGHGVTPACNITDARDHSLPVFGPLPILRQEALLPFVTTWQVADVVENPPVPLAKLTCPDFKSLQASTKTYAWDGLIDEHPQWMGRSGHGYFTALLELPEAMRLIFLMGYDGPYRIWVDARPLFDDLNGTNPCLPDKGRATLALRAGPHRVTVAMDINGGAAWGMRLRFVRRDLTKLQVKTGHYLRPVYSF